MKQSFLQLAFPWLARFTTLVGIVDPVPYTSATRFRMESIMDKDELQLELKKRPVPDLAAIVGNVTADLKESEKKEVAKGITKNVWPQESMHRMITILGSIALALGAGAMAVWASTVGAGDIATALVAVATAIVGGIFGFAQASK